MTKALVNFQGKPYISENKVLLSSEYSKYGITIDNLLGDVDSNGVLQIPLDTSDNIIFTGVKEIPDGMLSRKFNDCGNLHKGVIFPDLEKITGGEGMFASTNCSSVSFPKLKIIGARGLREAFQTCSLSSMDSISFPELEEVYTNALFWCFRSSRIKTFSFPKLYKFSESREFVNAFNYISLLENIYFNSLTTTSFTVNDSFNGMFNSSTGSEATGGCTVHFPSNMQSTISSLTGYPTFGGSSSYINLAFDLPATS